MFFLLVLGLLPITFAVTLPTITTSMTPALPQQKVIEALPTQTPSIIQQGLTTHLKALRQTAAPDPGHNIIGRQRCFNDQGFSVDCATWSGYRYTWGPPGNIYAGGPGDDGGGGNGIVSEATGQHDLIAFWVDNASLMCAVILMILAFIL